MHVCVDAVLYACVFAISVHVGERKKGTVTNHTTYYSSSVHESQVGVPSTAHYPHVRRRMVCCVVSNCALLSLSHLCAQKLQTHMHTTRNPYTHAYGPTIHTPTNTHVLLGTHIFFHRMMDTMMRTVKLNVQIPTPIKFSTSSRTLLW